MKGGLRSWSYYPDQRVATMTVWGGPVMKNFIGARLSRLLFGAHLQNIFSMNQGGLHETVTARSS
jgi:hypothetical protein